MMSTSGIVHTMELSNDCWVTTLIRARQSDKLAGLCTHNDRPASVSTHFTEGVL